MTFMSTQHKCDFSLPVGGAPAPSAIFLVFCAPLLGPRTSGWQTEQSEELLSAGGEEKARHIAKLAADTCDVYMLLLVIMRCSCYSLLASRLLVLLEESRKEKSPSYCVWLAKIKALDKNATSGSCTSAKLTGLLNFQLVF